MNNPVKNIIKISLMVLIITPQLIMAVSDETDPMKKLYENKGFGVYFLFYSDGNGTDNNGVVIFIRNKNEFDIAFEFVLVFRAGDIDKEQKVSGTLMAGERRTGSDNGLFFIPFDDHRSIGEVGIKSCRQRKR